MITPSDSDSDTDIKVIPFKKALEEDVKTIKIVHQSSSVSEMIMCEICWSHCWTWF